MNQNRPPLKDIVSYQIYTAKKSLLSEDLWMTVCLIVGSLSLLIQKYWLTILCLLLALILQSEKDVSTGRVTEYKRRKLGIPSKAQIKLLKQDKDLLAKQPSRYA
jgi:hypothetical protein